MMAKKMRIYGKRAKELAELKKRVELSMRERMKRDEAAQRVDTRQDQPND
jgi:hypothetical protein